MLPREQTPAIFWKYVNKANDVTGSFLNILHFARHTGTIDLETVNAQIEEHKRIYMDIYCDILGPDKVKIKETLERGQQVAEQDKNELE